MTLYQRVAYLDPDGVSFVEPIPSANGSFAGDLFKMPRTFDYNTYAGPGTYTLDRQGLVTLMAFDATPPWGGGVYCDAGFGIITKPDGSMDVLPFMQAMAAICSYGVVDEGLSHANRLNTAKLRPLEMRCGHTTKFVRDCAPGRSIETRQVHVMNVTAPNYFDDGHVLCEAKVGGVWKAFDVPNDCAWADSGGNLLSLAEIINHRPVNSERIMLAQPRVGRNGSGSTGFVPAIYEMEFRTPERALAWCERVYEVPGMSVGNGIVWGLPDHLSHYGPHITGYPGTNGSWSVMPMSDWVAAYY